MPKIIRELSHNNGTFHTLYCKLMSIYKEFYCFQQRIQIIFYNIQNHIAVNIKITMSYMITDADNIFPWNLRTIDQQSSICDLINLFDAFSNSFNKHTTGSKILHAVR